MTVSRGHQGFVTDLVPNYTRWADQVFSCGPEPMFRALRSSISPHRIGGKPRSRYRWSEQWPAESALAWAVSSKRSGA